MKTLVAMLAIVSISIPSDRNVEAVASSNFPFADVILAVVFIGAGMGVMRFLWGVIKFFKYRNSPRVSVDWIENSTTGLDGGLELPHCHVSHDSGSWGDIGDCGDLGGFGDG